MAYQPLVSVVMNCLNGERFVRKAIESVFAQTYTHWEIIFIDNASTDRTLEIAQSFGERVRYFRNLQTEPLGKARNQALQKTKGELIAFLDVDDTWFPEKLFMQVPLFENRPEIGLVYSDTELFFEDKGFGKSYFKANQCKLLRGCIFEDMLNHYAIPMLTTVVRREVLCNMSQWFDASYQVCDDFDFFMRVCYDWQVDFVEITLARCLIHSEAATVRQYKLAPGEMARTLLKLRSAHEDFDVLYGSAATNFSLQITYKQGISYWQEGLNSQARREFAKYRSKKKFILAFMASYLPFTLIKQIRHFLRRN
jgi:glycosyltransferase involved in cell wall biosynthesis